MGQFIAMFPGQGSQYVGMGKDLASNFGLAKRVFEEASEAISVDLRKLCFEGPESDLRLTENTQPCLLAASVAAYRVFSSECDLKPKTVVGHSLGEYSALVAAQGLSLAQASRLVRARGRAMQEAVPQGQGGMIAVLGLSDAVIEKLCKDASSGKDLIEPANYNTPGQVVLAGTAGGITQFQKLVQQPEFKGAKCLPLAVSAPFHCSLMKPAAEIMSRLFSDSRAAVAPLEFPYVPNTTGEVTHHSDQVLTELVRQIDHPVQWTKSIQTLLQTGASTFVEFGPGTVLQGLVKRIAKSNPVQAISAFGVSDTATLKATLQSLSAPLGREIPHE